MPTQFERGDESEGRAVSSRNVQANRKNALRSTGPRTPRGKAYSRRNAIKHGLFMIRPFIGDGLNAENHAQYKELLGRLVESYKPVGVTEQLEVERIAACWWKLGRASRYENAEIAVEHVNKTVRAHQRMSRNAPLSVEHARLVWLRTAKAEIESSDKISDELQAKMFADDPEFQREWESLEKVTKDKFADILAHLKIPASISDELSQDPVSVLLLTAVIAIYMIEQRTEHLAKGALEIASDRAAVPAAEALDRLLRAEAAAERSLNRAIDRLERLQRRRLGETLPPPVSVRLTR